MYQTVPEGRRKGVWITMKNRFWIILLSVLVLVCGLACIPMLTAGESARAEIASGGEVIAVVDLAVDQELIVTAPGGGSNTVVVKDGAVGVTEADCPDHYCMERGFCNGGTPIVCLPNRLTITFLGEQEIDGLAGQ